MDSGVFIEDAPNLLDGLGSCLGRVAERTTNSDSAPSICALLYSTTPSLPVSIGPAPLTAITS